MGCARDFCKRKKRVIELEARRIWAILAKTTPSSKPKRVIELEARRI
jgi:hypothetical protein